MQSGLKYGVLAVGLTTLAAGALTQRGLTQQNPPTATTSTPAEAKVYDVDWAKDYATGAAAAKQSGKLLFVEFRCER